jgi:hypothetical protein
MTAQVDSYWELPVHAQQAVLKAFGDLLFQEVEPRKTSSCAVAPQAKRLTVKNLIVGRIIHGAYMA